MSVAKSQKRYGRQSRFVSSKCSRSGSSIVLNGFSPSSSWSFRHAREMRSVSSSNDSFKGLGHQPDLDNHS